MQIWQIIVQSVLAASASVLVICIIGALMYKTKKIDQAFTSQLAGLIERVFLPSLIVTTFIRTVTIDQFWIVLPATVASVLVCVVGYIVGYLSNKYWIKDDQFEQLVILACANPHTTNIQLQVCSGLQYLLQDLTVHTKFPTEIDAGTRAITAIMIFTAINNTLRWTMGKFILLKFSDQQKRIEEIQMQDFKDGALTVPLLKPTQTKMQIFKSYLSMPLIAIAGAYLIIFIPPLQAMLIDKHTFLNRALYAPFNSIGRATSPCVLIMLGANIASIIERGGFKEGQNMNQRTLIMLTFSRLFIVPLTGIGVILVLAKIQFLTDPVDMFVTFFTFATPSAINIVVQAKQYTDYEDVVSVILVYGYLTAIITLPIWSMMFFFYMFQ